MLFNSELNTIRVNFHHCFPFGNMQGPNLTCSVQTVIRWTAAGKHSWRWFICANRRARGKSPGPQHFKLSIWSSLMCIDRHCTKGTRTIRRCLVCANSFPKKIPDMDPCVNNALFCVSRPWKGTVWVNIHANKQHCFTRILSYCGSQGIRDKTPQKPFRIFGRKLDLVRFVGWGEE